MLGLAPSVDLAVSLQKLAVMAAAAALYLAVARLKGRALDRLVWVLLGASVLVAIVGDVQVDRNAWKLDALNRPVYAWFGHLPRLNDLAFNQNALAAFLVLTIPFALAWCFRPSPEALVQPLALAPAQPSALALPPAEALALPPAEAVAGPAEALVLPTAWAGWLPWGQPFWCCLVRLGWRRGVSGGIAAFLLFELLLTESRAAMLSLGLALALFGVFGRGRWRWLALLAPLAAAGLLASGLVALPISLSWLPTGGSSRERLAIWQSALYMIADAPFTGIGLGMFQRIYPLYILPAYHNIHPHAHNLFLQTWVDAGVLGLAGMAGLVGLSVRAMFRVERTPLGIAAAVSSAAILMHAQVDCYFAGDPRTYAVMFLPLAMLSACTAPGPARVRAPLRSWQLASLALAPMVVAGSWLPALAWSNAGTIERLKGQPAAAAFKRSLAFRPANWVAERGLGLATGSVAQLRAALDAGPKSELAHFELAQALSAAGRDGEAILEWRQADAAPYLARQGTEPMLRLALAVNPRDGAASDQLAALLARQGRWPELRAFLARSPRTVQSLLLSSLMARVQDADPAAAAAILAEGAKADPHEPAFEAGGPPSIARGNALELLGLDAQAVAEYRRVAQTDPLGTFRLGELYLAEGRTGEALVQLQIAAQAIPNQEDFRLALARGYAGAGDTSRAEQEYRVVLGLDPGNREAINGSTGR